MSFYEPENMSIKERSEFELFYNRQKQELGSNWGTIAVMKEYCEDDVRVLAAGCLKFRQLFLELSGIDPFAADITLAGCVIRFFQAACLKKFQIGVVPPNGYSTIDKQSKIAMKYFKWIEHRDGNFYLNYKILKLQKFVIRNCFANCNVARGRIQNPAK